jgi:hypothetical protein
MPLVLTLESQFKRESTSKDPLPALELSVSLLTVDVLRTAVVVDMVLSSSKAIE